MFTILEHTKVFRDPIHRYIEIEYAIILKCIDTADFQRLRRIHQLGGVFQVYHTAEHSRFSHSLGVYQMMKRIIECVKGVKEALTAYDEVALLLAALLHDIGHGPFSHAFEAVSKVSHEMYTVRILLEETEVHQVLKEADEGLPQAVADIIEGKYRNPICHQLLSSQLDADRMDYLLRDSYFTGTTYGNFDLERILKTCYIKDQQLIVKETGIYAVEDYIMARYYMYWQVYYHRVSRAYEVMLIKLLERLKELLDQGDLEVRKYPMFTALFINESIAIQDYLALDETVAGYGIYAMQKSSDPVLKDLAKRLMNRKLFKHAEVQDKEEVLASIERYGAYKHAYYLEESNWKVPYKPEDAPILIESSRGEIRELSTCSSVIHALVNNKKDIKTTLYYG